MSVRLTKKRIAFITALASAKTYAEAYAEAYPKSADKPRRVLEERARKLLRHPEVMEAYQVLLNEYQQKERDLAGCEREDLIVHLNYSIEKIRAEIERREKALYAESDLLKKEPPSDMSPHEAELEAARVLQKPVLSSALTGGIVNAVNSLAKLLGYTEREEIVAETVVFAGLEDLHALDAEGGWKP